jgi:hypothetical protein
MASNAPLQDGAQASLRVVAVLRVRENREWVDVNLPLCAHGRGELLLQVGLVVFVFIPNCESQM